MAVRFPLASACDEVASVDMMSTTSKNGSYGKVWEKLTRTNLVWKHGGHAVPLKRSDIINTILNPKHLFYKIHLDEYKHLLSSPIT